MPLTARGEFWKVHSLLWSPRKSMSALPPKADETGSHAKWRLITQAVWKRFKSPIRHNNWINFDARWGGENSPTKFKPKAILGYRRQHRQYRLPKESEKCAGNWIIPAFHHFPLRTSPFPIDLLENTFGTFFPIPAWYRLVTVSMFRNYIICQINNSYAIIHMRVLNLSKRNVNSLTGRWNYDY